uniref:Uncharacterized protein n=1 Tax=Rhizophora mucronata TaxID=61149 RepID=A0A2P2NK09_RHIMU
MNMLHFLSRSGLRNAVKIRLLACSLVFSAATSSTSV